MKSNVSFFEAYAKANYNITDAFVVGVGFNYSPSVLNSGAKGYYVTTPTPSTRSPRCRTACTPYVSGEVGYWSLGTTDAFYGCNIAAGARPTTSAGIPYKSYTHLECRLRLDVQGVHGRSALQPTPT